MTERNWRGTERSREAQVLLETSSDPLTVAGHLLRSRHTAIRKPTLAQTGCMSQGYLKKMENVASGHLQLSNCPAPLAVPAAGRSILERKHKQFKLSIRVHSSRVTF